jgi:Amt family ammonium transporter
MTFAAITAALIIGALAERVRFSAMMLFACFWLTIVYAPLAQYGLGIGRIFVQASGAIDFAGGTVVTSIRASRAGGGSFRRPAGRPFGEPMPPHSLALTMTGAGLLWVGWFGFNAGSALEAETGCWPESR